MPRWDALIPILLAEGSLPTSNPSIFNSLLTSNGKAPVPEESSENRRSRHDKLMELAHDELATRCSVLRHPNDVVLLMMADLMAESPLSA